MNNIMPNNKTNIVGIDGSNVKQKDVNLAKDYRIALRSGEDLGVLHGLLGLTESFVVVTNEKTRDFTVSVPWENVLFVKEV